VAVSYPVSSRGINRPASVTMRARARAHARVITLFSTLERARRSFLLDSAVPRRDIPPLKRDGTAIQPAGVRNTSPAAPRHATGHASLVSAVPSRSTAQ